LTIGSILQALVRRWYLTVVGLLLTVGLCIGAMLVVPPKYSAKADVLLLPPSSTVGKDGNPYLLLGGLSQVVDVLSRAMMSQEMTDEIYRVDAGAAYTAEADVATSGPILAIQVESMSPARTMSDLALLLDQVPRTLVNLQSGLGIDDPNQIRSMVLTRQAVPEVVTKSTLRAVIAVGAGGLAVVVLLVGLLDGLLNRRRGGRQGKAWRSDQAVDRSAEAMPTDHGDDRVDWDADAIRRPKRPAAMEETLPDREPDHGLRQAAKRPAHVAGPHSAP
jgi:hypothetical protein